MGKCRKKVEIPSSDNILYSLLLLTPTSVEFNFDTLIDTP